VLLRGQLRMTRTGRDALRLPKTALVRRWWPVGVRLAATGVAAGAVPALRTDAHV